MKKRIGSAIGAAVVTAAIPASNGIWDYRVLAGCAAAGALGGFFGVNIPAMAKRFMAAKKAGAVKPPV